MDHGGIDTAAQKRQVDRGPAHHAVSFAELSLHDLKKLLAAVLGVFADPLKDLSDPRQVISLPLCMGGVHNGTAPSMMIFWMRSRVGPLPFPLIRSIPRPRPSSRSMRRVKYSRPGVQAPCPRLDRRRSPGDPRPGREIQKRARRSAAVASVLEDLIAVLTKFGHVNRLMVAGAVGVAKQAGLRGRCTDVLAERGPSSKEPAHQPGRTQGQGQDADVSGAPQQPGAPRRRRGTRSGAQRAAAWA